MTRQPGKRAHSKDSRKAAQQNCEPRRTPPIAAAPDAFETIARLSRVRWRLTAASRDRRRPPVRAEGSPAKQPLGDPDAKLRLQIGGAFRAIERRSGRLDTGNACSHYVLLARGAETSGVSGRDGHCSHHPSRGPRCLLCIGRAAARSVFTRRANRSWWRRRARRLVRSQGLWHQQRHVGMARPRALSATDLCRRAFQGLLAARRCCHQGAQ